MPAAIAYAEAVIHEAVLNAQRCLTDLALTASSNNLAQTQLSLRNVAFWVDEVQRMRAANQVALAAKTRRAHTAGLITDDELEGELLCLMAVANRLIQD